MNILNEEWYISSTKVMSRNKKSGYHHLVCVPTSQQYTTVIQQLPDAMRLAQGLAAALQRRSRASELSAHEVALLDTAASLERRVNG